MDTVTPPRNEAAERLRRMVKRLSDAAGPAWTPDDPAAVIDAALAEERRHVIEQIRDRVTDLQVLLDDLSTPQPGVGANEPWDSAAVYLSTPEQDR